MMVWSCVQERSQCAWEFGCGERIPEQRSHELDGNGGGEWLQEEEEI